MDYCSSRYYSGKKPLLFLYNTNERLKLDGNRERNMNKRKIGISRCCIFGEIEKVSLGIIEI